MTFEVLPENADAVRIFVLSCSQWRVGGMGELVGLDYNIVLKLIDLYKVKKKKRTFEGVRVMEQAILRKLSQERK